MNTYTNIENKLQEFIQKFYVNELLKGIILFFSIGVLYLFFTLFIEHFLWLKPVARTILFWLFIVVEIGLLLFYILIPISKLIGFRKGISSIEASKIIGNHFPEVSDKLLNMLQLKSESSDSELIAASIEQKSKDLQFVPFKKAIDFSKNKKYLKYAVLPILIWFLVFVTNNISIFGNSFTRVVKHSVQFEKSAPFTFFVLNDSLNVIEGNSLNIQIETTGELVPENVTIHFNNETYFTQSTELGKFEYTFNSINNSTQFYVEANGYTSKKYEINAIKTPVITNLKMSLQYPKYTGKVNEIIENTGNAMIPVGTKVSWLIDAHQTTKVHFSSNTEKLSFELESENSFELKKTITKNTDYTISTSNENLENYEKLNFRINVISDDYPKIIVKSNIDSISRGPAHFLGQLSDDYGVDKLVLKYYNRKTKDSIFQHKIDISKGIISDFFYEFPEGLAIKKGIEYELFFEVFDNDRVRGSKASKSRVFSYYNKTDDELKEDVLNDQKESINDLNKTLEKSNEIQEKMDDFKNELQKKESINWNDTKKLEEFMKRQQQYDEMLNKQTEAIKNNLNEQPEIDDLKDKKEELLKRIEEVKQNEKQEKLQEELDKLLSKLEKDDLTKKLKELSKKNQQKKQTLERLLELTKRFYVEKKANQIAEKLEQLSKEQEELSDKKQEDNKANEQEKLNEKFDEIKEDFNELEKQNTELTQEMSLPETKEEEKKIEEDLNKALEELQKDEAEVKDEKKEDSKTDFKSKKKNLAKKNQKEAVKKMKELSQKMTQSMEAMEGEQIDENIDDLRKIVENLIEFSFQQEELFDKFSTSNNDHPEYAKNLKQQYVLKEYFEHIDDSLYMLSLRLVKLGGDIQKEVSNVHFNIDESLENFTDNKFNIGISNQQFVITSANNLANSLSNLLESLMNASPSFGQGKGKGGKGDFSLPDIIKKQGEISEEMKEGMKKGEKGKGEKDGEQKSKGEGEQGEQGEGGENEEMSNEELFEIYKKQSELKEMLKEMIGDEKGKDGKGKGGEAVKQMEEIEQQLLEKGFSQEVIDRIDKLNHELLKLEEAEKQQGEDSKRESKTSVSNFRQRNINELELKKQYFKTNEILNRQSLPLRSIYKKKVQEYFKEKQ